MNKRIKFKKGILKNKCDGNCYNYELLTKEHLISNNMCIGCKHKEKSNLICENNLKMYENTKGITVYKINEYEWWASKWGIKETNEYYKKEYNLNEDENPTEKIITCNLDKNGLWVETTDEKDLGKLGKLDELISCKRYPNGKVKRNVKVGDLMRSGGKVKKYITFREALLLSIDFNEPYCLCSIK